MSKRKGLSQKARFEVFKRDKFTCQYCGRKAPDVVLRVDHIEPVSRGGKNEILNLVTACQDCNSGKGATPLDDSAALDRQRQQLEELQERREQLEMLLRWKQGLVDLSTDASEQVAKFWASLVPGWILNETGLAELKLLLSRYGADVVTDAMRDAVKNRIRLDENGKPTAETVSGAWSNVRPICRVAKAARSDPYLRNASYIRGILRNRFAYCNERLALQYLRRALELGYDPEDLKEMARDHRCWSTWEVEIGGMISKAEKEDVG